MNIFVHRKPWIEKIGVVVSTSKQVAIGFNWTPILNEEAVDGDTFALSYTEAQAFVDELWAAGFRPTESKGSAGALSAVQYHLEDLRRLIFRGKP